MRIALTRPVPTSIAHCELTHLERQPIDLAVAAAQHQQYERALAAVGCDVRHLPATDDLPDSVFVEDTAIILDEIAVMTHPGAESRRAETSSVAKALSQLRQLAWLEAPATIDGGDVMRIGKQLYVGLSTRTNERAIDSLRRILALYGYDVTPVDVRGILHLKSAVTPLPGGAVLLNGAFIDRSIFDNVIEVDSSEPMAANVLTIGDDVLCAQAFPRTRERLEKQGFRTTAVDLSELAKAEGALTCCSLILEQ
jgi:dimethylargininase